jgi:dTDP-4-dehydrorhamnose reductase
MNKPVSADSVRSNGHTRSLARILVVGARGMLGQDLVARLRRDGESKVTGLDLPDIDITDYRNVASIFGSVAPDLVINCAAYTAVDKAELEPEVAFAVNREGSANLAGACGQFGIPLVHISTDYVFDGSADRPYREDDPASPVSVYGMSKWEGEEAVRSRLSQHLVVRTSWLYGAHGASFVSTMLRLARERDEIKVVDDQIGCPTWTGSLAGALVVLSRRIMEDPSSFPWGTYHYCGEGRTSWRGFAQVILEEGQRKETLKAGSITPITTAEYPTAARRPLWSVLDCGKIKRAFDLAPRPWQDDLREMMTELYAR